MTDQTQKVGLKQLLNDLRDARECADIAVRTVERIEQMNLTLAGRGVMVRGWVREALEVCQRANERLEVIL